MLQAADQLGNVRDRLESGLKITIFDMDACRAPAMAKTGQPSSYRRIGCKQRVEIFKKGNFLAVVEIMRKLDQVRQGVDEIGMPTRAEFRHSRA